VQHLADGTRCTLIGTADGGADVEICRVYGNPLIEEL
jgi:hypothetical protein